jgi:hypothetical protein
MILVIRCIQLVNISICHWGIIPEYRQLSGDNSASKIGNRDPSCAPAVRCALRSRTDRRRATEVTIAVSALNRMLELDARSPPASLKLRQAATECVLRLIRAT